MGGAFTVLTLEIREVEKDFRKEIAQGRTVEVTNSQFGVNLSEEVANQINF